MCLFIVPHSYITVCWFLLRRPDAVLSLLRFWEDNRLLWVPLIVKQDSPVCVFVVVHGRKKESGKHKI